jgi:hypothetical protein
MAVDPASERDNFSVVVLECWPDHRRIVFCWTTTRARYKAKLKRGLAEEGDFYHYTARKIRDLMKASRRAGRHRRPGRRRGGHGGPAGRPGCCPASGRFYPVIDPEEPRRTPTACAGDHIIEVVQFAKADWVRDANHGLRKDFEDKALLFPSSTRRWSAWPTRRTRRPAG